MSTADLAALIEQYRTGLEAELVLLVLLQEIAARQQETTQRGRYRRSAGASATSATRSPSELVTIEQQIRPAHETADARGRPRRTGCRDSTHAVGSAPDRRAHGERTFSRSTATRFVRSSRSSRDRRTATQAAEQAEATLAAYGRMLAPPPTATLVNRRG